MNPKLNLIEFLLRLTLETIIVVLNQEDTLTNLWFTNTVVFSHWHGLTSNH